jgi:hypothetical protein
MNNSLRLEKLETLMLIDPRQVVLHVLYDGDDEPAEADKDAAIEAYIQLFGEQPIIVIHWRAGIFMEWQRPDYSTRLVDAAEAERRMGQLLKETELNTGSLLAGKDIGGYIQLPPNETPTLAELGLTKRESAEAQKLAELPLSQIESDDELLWTPVDLPLTRGIQADNV